MNMSLDHKVVPQKSTMMMLADTKSSDDNYLYPSHPNSEGDDLYADVGRTASFQVAKNGRAVQEFDDTIDFKDNSGGWTSSNSYSRGSGSLTGSGSADSGATSSPESSLTIVKKPSP